MTYQPIINSIKKMEFSYFYYLHKEDNKINFESIASKRSFKTVNEASDYPDKFIKKQIKS